MDGNKLSTACDLIIDIFNNPTVMAILDLAFVSLIIVIGGVMGAYTRLCRDISKDGKKNKVNGIRFGIASSFICVPFISSFLHVDYSSIIFPIDTNAITKFIEQVFLLISVAGISSYLGATLLDGLADKVLKQQVENLGKKQDDLEAEQDESKALIAELEKDKKITHFELGYFKAISALDKAENLLSQDGEDLSAGKKLKEGLDAIDEALLAVDKSDVKKDDYDRLLVLKAYILKRMNRIKDALDITELLMDGKEDNPILIYNKACYKYLLRQCDNNYSDIKDLIKKALLVPVDDPEFKRRQAKIKTKIFSKKEPDLEGLFNDDELQALKELCL